MDLYKHLLASTAALALLILCASPGQAQVLHEEEHHDNRTRPEIRVVGGPTKILGSSYLGRYWNPGPSLTVSFAVPLTEYILLRPSFSYYRLRPDWEALRMGPHDWSNSMFFLSFDALLRPATFSFGLSPYGWIGVGLYKENIPVRDFNAEIIWTVEALQPGFQSGLGLTGGIGLKQTVLEQLSVLAEGSVAAGISREITGSRGRRDAQGNFHVDYYRETRIRQLVSLSIGLQYTL